MDQTFLLSAAPKLTQAAVNIRDHDHRVPTTDVRIHDQPTSSFASNVTCEV